MGFNLDESIGFLLSRTSLKMKNNLNKHFKPYDITTEQWGLINRLWAKDGISQKELADLMMKDQPTVTRILDKLEHKNLIKRRANPADRREFLVYITEKGQELEHILVPIAQSCLAEALKGFTNEEVELLKRMLNRIFCNLE